MLHHTLVPFLGTGWNGDNFRAFLEATENVENDRLFKHSYKY